MNTGIFIDYCVIYWKCSVSIIIGITRYSADENAYRCTSDERKYGLVYGMVRWQRVGNRVTHH
jgi:hypothetical protein